MTKNRLPMPGRMHYCRGLSLVELMVALVLGLVLIAGVLQVFLGNRQAQRMEQSVARVEENGRIAIDLITQDLRAAGYYGCARTIFGEISNASLLNIHDNSGFLTGVTDADGYLSRSVRGFQRAANGVWQPSLAADIAAASARNGSDLLAVFFGEDLGAKLTGTVSGTANITALRDPDGDGNAACVTQNDRVLLGNCSTVDLVRVTNAQSCSGNMSLEHGATLAGIYKSESSSLAVLRQSVFYVQDTGRTTPDGQPVFSLYRNGEELIEGVEFLRVLYGERLDSGAVRYREAGAAGLDPAAVVSVRVGLLVRSFDAVRMDADTQSYILLDQNIAASGTTITHNGGRSLRRVFTATVDLRNRNH